MVVCLQDVRKRRPSTIAEQAMMKGTYGNRLLNGSFTYTEMGTGTGTESLFRGISLWLQLYNAESSHWTKTGTHTPPKLVTVPISGTGPHPRERSLCM